MPGYDGSFLLMGCFLDDNESCAIMTSYYLCYIQRVGVNIAGYPVK